LKILTSPELTKVFDTPICASVSASPVALLVMVTFVGALLAGTDTTMPTVWNSASSILSRSMAQ
jgi:hypothetical protein